jgi:predicted metalloprotease
MRLDEGRQSTNIEDRRGFTVGRGAIGAGGIILALVAALLGAPAGTVRDILGGGGTTTSTPGEPTDLTPEEAKLKVFMSRVLANTEDVWGAVFSAKGRTYEQPHLVLFRDAVESACGVAQSAVGPFYCPPDHKLYLDLGFFSELDRRFGAPGDFAQAYVVAHEVGHHVQNLLGISERVQAQRQRTSEVEANQISVLTELQADCFAGVWAHHANKEKPVLEPGDVEEGLRAAAAIGDDTLQRKARGQVAPESFTHGSSAQRVRWLKTGLEQGTIESCNTFARAN